MRTAIAAAALAMLGMAVTSRASLSGPPIIYEGQIDGKLAVTMELYDDGTTHTFSGKYMYATSGKDISVKGKADGGVLTLTEENGDRVKTGTFQLTRNEDGSLTGTWTSVNGGRVLSVALAKIGEKKPQAESKPGSYDVRMGYVEFASRNSFLELLNAKLSSEARNAKDAAVKEAQADARAQTKAPTGQVHYEWRASSDPKVTYADAGLVSIRTMHLSDTGGAHPNYGYIGATYAWKDDKLVTLGIEDLVQPAMLKALAAICVKSLKVQGATAAEDLVFDKKHPPTVNVTHAGLLLTFDPYAVGSYAEGVYVVMIPWKETGNFVPEDSPVRRLMGNAGAEPAAPGVKDKPPQTNSKTPPPSAGGDFPRPG